jgi:hypothetical protein
MVLTQTVQPRFSAKAIQVKGESDRKTELHVVDCSFQVGRSVCRFGFTAATFDHTDIRTVEFLCNEHGKELSSGFESNDISRSPRRFVLLSLCSTSGHTALLLAPGS